MRSKLTIDYFTLPKHGNTVDENEDYFSFNLRKNSLVAVSDGATESAFAREWAKMLVQSDWKTTLLSKVTSEGDVVPEEVVACWINPIREKFQTSQVGKELPWYAREKVRQGAFATFLAFRMNERGRWWATSCGDTCLFTIADGNITGSAPLQHADEFGSQPSLVSSNSNTPLPILSIHRGSIGSEKSAVLLTTDAISAWLLGHDDAYLPTRAHRLLACREQAEFEMLVMRERELGTLRNDDVTALLLQAPGAR